LGSSAVSRLEREIIDVVDGDGDDSDDNDELYFMGFVLVLSKERRVCRLVGDDGAGAYGRRLLDRSLYAVKEILGVAMVYA